jgi:hypothetical protein
MPRRKKTLEEQKYPKTTGLTVTGSCGHVYVRRVRLETVGGKFKTPENIARYDESVVEYTTWFARHECLECEARTTLRDVDSELSLLVQVFALEPLPTLDGTERVRAFAERLRFQAFRTIASDEARYMSRRLRQPSLADELFVDALRRSRTWDKVADRDQLALLTRQMNTAGIDMYEWPRFVLSQIEPEPSTQAQVRALATWLVVRWTVLHSMVVSRRADSRWWMMRVKGTYQEPNPRRDLGLFDVPDSQVHFLAAAVAKLDCWESPMDAYAALTMMMGGASDSVEVLADDAVDVPLPDLLETVRIMSVLRPKPVDDLPF